MLWGYSNCLSPEEEHEIVITCHVLADMVFPLNKDLVSLIIRDYINEKYQENPFESNGIPGCMWWEFFLWRRPNLSKHRPVMADINSISQWFTKYESLLTPSGLSTNDDLSSHLWNCDKTRFCTAVASRSVLCRRRAKSVHETDGGSGRENITVLGWELL